MCYIDKVFFVSLTQLMHNGTFSKLIEINQVVNTTSLRLCSCLFEALWKTEQETNEIE